MNKLGIRRAVHLAEDHAIGILESTDDLAFWGEKFFDEHEEDYKTMAEAKKIVLNRIRRKR